MGSRQTETSESRVWEVDDFGSLHCCIANSVWRELRCLPQLQIPEKDREECGN